MSIIPTMIEVKVDAVRMSLMSPGQQVVILKAADSERYLPIFVGKPEGDAIILHLREEEATRPLTHDLALQVLENLQGSLSHVLISELRNNHFHAQVVMQVKRDDASTDEGTEVTMDARPSDAIALAIRARCAIFVDEDVMEVAAVHPLQDEAASNLGAFEDFLDSLDFDDLDKS